MIPRICSLLYSIIVTIAIPLPVQKFDVLSYLGTWYQVYTDAVNEATFENSTYCATATYGLNDNSTISVLNKARIGNITGTPYVIQGWAAPTPNTTYEGELTVELQGIDFPAPYWIYQLGPTNSNNQYDYSIVSDQFQFSLFVLARNVSDFYMRYNPQVLEYLQTNGWNQSLNKPIQVPQIGCTYF